ncbi:MAG: 4-hydroxy-tetrahydrodipicolinate reductase [Sphingobacteriales bacterium]|jgi:4-hydroxy-tetrahydrodipicolinate reductase|nr:4-hydroxy-tetrahydrodipicolinate reductase [Sphingobacteriales bacterium]
MKIALIGYGKMGKAIEEIALQRNHEIVLKIDINNIDEFSKENLSKADAAIEFTSPHTAFDNVTKLLEFGVPVVSGSTGWFDRLDKARELSESLNGSMLCASNFSVGVNLFFELNKKLAYLMHPHQEYNVTLEEIHHTEKKDAPSGTAITLAEQIMEVYTEKLKWVSDTSPAEDELLIISKRIDPAPGTHILTYASETDDIAITHTAHSRKGFALGAVLAAEYISDKKGWFTMKEVLGL